MNIGVTNDEEKLMQFLEMDICVAYFEEKKLKHFSRWILVLWKGASVARRSVGCLSLGPWIPFLLPHPFYNIFLFTAYYLFKLTHVTFLATSCLLLSLHPFLLPFIIRPQRLSVLQLKLPLCSLGLRWVLSSGSWRLGSTKGSPFWNVFFPYMGIVSPKKK